MGNHFATWFANLLAQTGFYTPIRHLLSIVSPHSMQISQYYIRSVNVAAIVLGLALTFSKPQRPSLPLSYSIGMHW